jgi:uncharacterized protein involved in exopolysaccharide biosynthesis
MSNTVSFLDLLNLIRRGRRVIAIMFVIGVLAGLVLALVLPVRYEAQVTFVAADTAELRGGLGLDGRLADLADMAGLAAGGSSNNIEKYLAILTSREFTELFLREEAALPELFPKLWDASSNKWKPSQPSFLANVGAWLDARSGSPRAETPAQPAPGRAAGEPSSWEAFRKFDLLRTVSRDRRTGIVTLTIRWRDPRLAAAWANRMLARANQQIRVRAMEEANRNLHYLSDQLKETDSMELRNALFKLSESEQRKRMLASVRPDYAFEVIDPAVTPEQHASPHRAALVISLGIVGIFLGMGIVIVRALGRPTK